MASITKLPSGAYRVQIRRKGRYASETFLRRDDAHRWARQAETRVDQGLAPNKSSVSRLTTFGDLIDLHIIDMCEVGKSPRRSKAATLKTLKRDLQRFGIIDQNMPFFAFEAKPRGSAERPRISQNAVGKEKIGHLDRCGITRTSETR